MTELERFLALFTQQVQHTWDTVAHIDHPVWTTVPIDSDANYLGLRVNRITIAALLRHLCLTETLWFNTLPLLDPEAVMAPPNGTGPLDNVERSDEHTSELQSLMRISYAVFCLKKKKHIT